MGSNQSNSAKEILNTANNLYENSSSVCISSCDASFTGNTVVISGVDVNGNINLTNQCEASASCVMQSQLDGQIQNIMSASANQSNITEQLFPFYIGFQNKSNSITIQENITNNVTQVLQSICQATDNTLVSNNTIVATNSRVGGDLNITNQGSSNADCTINNLTRISLFNQQTATTNQTAKDANILGVIFIAIVIILVIGAIIMVVILGPEGISAIVSHSKTDTGNGEGSELDSLLGEGEGGLGEGGGGLGGLGEGEGGLSEAAEFA